MTRIVICRSFRQIMNFMRFPDAEGAFLRALRFFLKKSPILKNGPHALFLALSDGRPVMRAATGVDWAYQKNTGGYDGYLSLFEGEERRDVAKALFRAVDDFQKSHNSARVIGPIPLEAYAFGYGLCLAESNGLSAPILPRNPTYYAEIFEENGYAAHEDYLGFHFSIDAPGLHRIEQAGAWAHGRFRVTVRRISSVDLSSLGRFIQKVLNGDGQATEFPDIIKALRAIKPLMDSRYLFAAFQDGEPAGYLLAYPYKGGVHLFTLHVSEKRRPYGLYVALVSALVSAARRDGVRSVCAAVISRENTASIRCAMNTGGEIEQIYRIYHKDIGGR